MLNPARPPNEQRQRPINAHLYPVLTSFVAIYGAIQIAPIAGTSTSVLKPENVTGKPLNGIGAVAACNGRPGADVVIVD